MALPRGFPKQSSYQVKTYHRSFIKTTTRILYRPRLNSYFSASQRNFLTFKHFARKIKLHQSNTEHVILAAPLQLSIDQIRVKCKT